MANIYNNVFFKTTDILGLILLLSILLVLLNKIIYISVDNKITTKERTLNKGLETYEFGTHSVGSISTVSSNQFLILAVLFLLFDIELVFLIPWCISVDLLNSVPNLIIVTFINCIFYCLLVELKLNALNWYKGSTMFYL